MPTGPVTLITSPGKSSNASAEKSCRTVVLGANTVGVAVVKSVQVAAANR